MEKEFNQLYEKIGYKIISMIPTEWDKIYFLGQVGKGKCSWSSVFYFIDSSTKKIVQSNNIPKEYEVSKQIYKQLLVEVSNLVVELYDCFDKHEQEPWTQLSICLDSTGKINVNFNYTDFEKLKWGPMKIEIVWAYETFGLIPEGYAKTILDEYLSSKDN